MDKQILIDAGVDYGTGLHRFSDREELYRKYLKEFMHQTEYEEFCKNMDSGEYEDAFNAAHSLKGITGYLSMQQLYDSFTCMTEMLRGLKDIESAKEYYHVIKEEYGCITDAIGRYFSE